MLVRPGAAPRWGTTLGSTIGASNRPRQDTTSAKSGECRTPGPLPPPRVIGLSTTPTTSSGQFDDSPATPISARRVISRCAQKPCSAGPGQRRYQLVDPEGVIARTRQ